MNHQGGSSHPGHAPPPPPQYGQGPPPSNPNSGGGQYQQYQQPPYQQQPQQPQQQQQRYQHQYQGGPPPPNQMMGGGGGPPPPPNQMGAGGGGPGHPGHGVLPPPPNQGQQPPVGGGGGGGPPRMTGWQNPDRDYEIRRTMIAQIVRLLQQRKPDAPREWLQKLPDMARRLEDKLYQYAASLDEYKDRNSLKQRLQYIALKISKDRPPHGGMPQHHPQGGPPPPPSGPSQQQAQKQPPVYGGQPPQQPPGGPGGPNGGGGGPQRPGGYPPQTGGQPQQQYYQQYPPNGQQGPPQGGGGGASGAGGSSGGPPQQTSQNNFPPVPHPMQHQASSNGMPNGSGGKGNNNPQSNPVGNGGGGGNRNPQHQKILQQQQQRLLLLRHASKCQYTDQQVCPNTPHCKQMKALWAHIANCKDNHCRFPHCVSSRYVLTHYYKCRNPNCEVCRPVKDVIRGQQLREQSRNPNAGGPIPPMQRTNSFQTAAGAALGHVPPPTAPGGPPPPHGQPRDGQQPPMTDMEMKMQQLEAQRKAAADQVAEYKKKMMELEQQINQVKGGQPAQQPPHPGAPPPPHMDSIPPPPVPSAGPIPPVPNVGAGRGRGMRRKQSSQSGGGKPIAAGAVGRGGGVIAPPQHPGMHPGKPGPIPPGGVQPPLSGPGAQLPPGEYERQQRLRYHQQQQQQLAAQQRLQQQQQQQQQARGSHMFRIDGGNPAFSGSISLINTFHRDDIKKHIASLVRFSAQIKPTELRQKLQPLLRRQLDHQCAYIFLKPVDPVAMDLPDYFEVIKHPMDLMTIKRRLESNYYKSLKSFASDMLLVYDNAILYNPPTPNGFGVHETAKEYAQSFVNDYNNLLLKMKKEEEWKRVNKDACRLCGGGQYQFEPPVYYCNGKCNAKIKRNAFFYATPDNKVCYCQPCFNALTTDSIQLEDGQMFPRASMEKRRNAEISEESWVECNHCKRWYHQICVLFNSRNEESKSSQYFCPVCILRYLDRYRIEQIPRATPAQVPNGNNSDASKNGGASGKHTYRAKELPRCKFSDFIEERLKKRILIERKKKAQKDGVLVSDIPEPGALTCRVVLNKDTEVFPRKNLERLYKDPPYNYPKSFPYKVKCVLLFQNIDGVDVLVFALYTQSYGSDCPPPNHRTVYIAYLDSVFYMKPRFLRTPMYQELLIAMLEYEKNRGHTKAFIWSCPPLAGDDYILYCHPKEQKTQKAEMLRAWYVNLLEDARKRGIVVSVDNLYDAYMRRLPNPCGIPAFDGDYWPGVTEQYIEELERENHDPKGLAPRAKRAISRNKTAGSKKAVGKKSSSKSKKAKGTKLKKKAKKTKYRGNRTSFLKDEDRDEDDENENPIWPPPPPAKWVELASQDALTAKIGDAIKQMKDDFFVVYMHHICAECAKVMDTPDELYWLPKQYKEGMGDLDLIKNKHAPPYALCHECYVSAYENEFNRQPTFTPPPTLEEHKKMLEAVKSEKRKNEESDTAQGSQEPERKKVKSEEGNDDGDGNNDKDNKINEKVEIKKENETSDDVSKNMETDNGDKNNDQSATANKSNADGSEESSKTNNSDPTDSQQTEGSSPVEDEKKEDEEEQQQEEEEPQQQDGEEESGNNNNGSSSATRVAEEQERILEPGVTAKPQNPWLTRPCSLEDMVLKRAHVEKETNDPDPPMDNQFFDTRQQFLSLCQGNRYQYDQLRRAKHSSFMVLYHLFNPDEPGFVHSCNVCSQEIKDELWYKCETCDDYDVCQSCAPKAKHPHQLKRTEQKSKSGQGANSRQNASVQQHLKLLAHASACKNTACPDPYCAKMKQLLRHGLECKVRLQGGCKLCKRVWWLLQCHARQCRIPTGRCPVPRCGDLKNHLRRQQAALQDRRIRAQTTRMAAERQDQQQQQQQQQAVGQQHQSVGQQHIPTPPPQQQQYHQQPHGIPGKPGKRF